MQPKFPLSLCSFY